MKFGVSDLLRLRTSLAAMALMFAFGATAALYARDRIAGARAALAAVRAERGESTENSSGRAARRTRSGKKPPCSTVSRSAA